MKKGILKVRKTNKGKIFVQIDRQNGKAPMPLSYVRLPDTSLNDKECTYETDKKGIFISISVDGKEVWKKEESKNTRRGENNPRRNQGNRQSNNPQHNNPQGFSDSFSKAHTLLPKDVRHLNGLKDIDNFALKFHKAARYELNHRGDKHKFFFFKNDYRTRTKLEIVPNFGHIDFRAINQRQQEQVTSSFPSNNRHFNLLLNWRMVIGLGGDSVYETGMTLHPVYGIPYIPSSSIKGVLRSWIIRQLFDNDAPEIKEKEKREKTFVTPEARAIHNSSIFCILFGCPKEIRGAQRNLPSALDGKESQGSLRFFDAFPNKAPKLKTDVMNVHYQDWYKEIGYKPPTDTQRTNPIPFLTVDNANDLAFGFNLAITQNQKLSDFKENYHAYIQGASLTPDSTLLDFATYWLKQALTNHGIGAKTAVGYGQMIE